MVLITDLTWAVFTVYTGFLIRKLDPLVLTFYSSCIAAAVIIPVALTGGFADYANVTILSGGSVIFLGIGCLAMAFWCYTIGIAQFGAGRAGAYLYLEPVFTVLGAYYFLNEKVTMVLVAAAILITLGVYLCERRSSSVVQKPPAG